MLTNVVNGFENRRPITYDLSCMIYFYCCLHDMGCKFPIYMVAVRCLLRLQGATELFFDTERWGFATGLTHPSAAEGPKDLGFLPSIPFMYLKYVIPHLPGEGC